jgi:predicted DNA-binding protein
MYTHMKKNTFQIRMSEEEKNALAELATELDRPAAQIVREAIKEKIAERVSPTDNVDSEPAEVTA